MTAEQIYRLRKSFHLLERRADMAGFYFYEQLFAMDPGLRPFLQTDIELQGIKLTGMLGEVLELLERPIELGAMLHELGAEHSEYGVQPAQYATIGTALISMLEDVLGTDLTLETRQAWVALYHRVAQAMLEGADLAAH